MDTTSEENISLYSEESRPSWTTRVCVLHQWVVVVLLVVIAACSIMTLPVMWAYNKLTTKMQKMELIMVDAKIATYKDNGKFVVLWKGSHLMDNQSKTEHE